MKGNFNQIIKGEKPVLVDFHAEWCGPCKTLSPTIKEVASELKDKLKVIKIDVDKNNQLAQRYNVRSVPTMILFKNGRTAWRQSGALPKHMILQAVEQNI